MDYHNIFISMKKDKSTFSKYCKSYFPTTQSNDLTYIMLEVAVPRFPPHSCSKHFRKYWWKCPYFTNDCLWKRYLWLDFNCQNLTFVFTHSVKVNESRYIALFVVSGSIKKLSLIDFVNAYFSSIFFSIVFAKFYIFLIFFSKEFAPRKSVGLPHIAYIVIH